MGNSRRATVLIMAGGTGGHVFPALAVAELLHSAGVRVAWMGTRQGLEARVVPAHGFPMHWVRVSGLRGKGLLKMLKAPLILMMAIIQSFVVFMRVRPEVVLGMGGFVSGPGGLVAWLLRRPLILHEQNSVPGLTNRLLAPLARVVMEAFPGSFAAERKALTIGNPLRRDFQAPCEDTPDSSGTRFRVLVVGGSLGARAINEIVPQAVARIASGQRPEIWHQAGERNLAAARQAYDRAGVTARVDAFIEDMHTAYCWADLVVCRSGALTVSELAAVGVASVLVPFPYAVDDHQTANARQLERLDAAVLVAEKNLGPDRLAELLINLNGQSGRLREMGNNARVLARPDAAAQVARQCMLAMRRPPAVEVAS